MAARLNRRHQDFVREKIRASQIINHLQNHIDGEVDMSATQLKAAEVLLRKALPDLKATEFSTDPDTVEALKGLGAFYDTVRTPAETPED